MACKETSGALLFGSCSSDTWIRPEPKTSEEINKIAGMANLPCKIPMVKTLEFSNPPSVNSPRPSSSQMKLISRHGKEGNGQLE